MTNEISHNVVCFRDGDLKERLFLRGDSAGAIANRDLQRYYALLKEALYKVNLTADEAYLLCDLCRDYLFDIFQIDPKENLYLALKDEYASSFFSRWGIDPEKFIDKFAQLNSIEVAAIIDAAERYWYEVDRRVIQDSDQTLIDLGLVKQQKRPKVVLKYDLEFNSEEEANLVQTALQDALNKTVSSAHIEAVLKFERLP